MNSTIKVWTSLGLATALVGAGLAGCAGEGGEGGEGDKSAIAGEAGEGEGGEGESGAGESGAGDGEGGIAVADAATDAVVYGSALAVVEAHAIAARDAYSAGKAQAAAEMFAHPVSEVLADMAPVFETLGVADFSGAMSDASAAALKPDNGKAVSTAFKAIESALEAAAAKAPASDQGEGAVAAGVVADQIERATAMYGRAAASQDYEPYLDGYGFSRSAASAFARKEAAIKTYNPGLHGDIKAALALLATAYPGAQRPAALDIAQGQLLGASSKVNLGLPTP